jgi:lysozyme
MSDKKQKVVDFLASPEIEHCKLTAYLDTKGIPTIGIGSIKYPSGVKVKMNDTCTRKQAYEWCLSHLEKHVFPGVDKLCKSKNVPDKVWIALCSLVYNVGAALNGESIKKAIAKEDWEELAEAFKLYNGQRNPDGSKTVIPGLVNRRAREIAYFLNKNED